MLKSLTNSIPYSTFEYLKLITMVNEWINQKLHPITGIRENNKVYVKPTTQSKETQEKYFEDRELLNKVVLQQTVSSLIDYNNV